MPLSVWRPCPHISRTLQVCAERLHVASKHLEELTKSGSSEKARAALAAWHVVAEELRVACNGAQHNGAQKLFEAPVLAPNASPSAD